MRVVTLARKPCSGGSTTSNVARHQAGAINTDGCRIGLQSEKNVSGRWPANVVLVHRPGCRRVGTVLGSGYVINRWADGAKPFGGGAGHKYESEKQPDESVAVWECASDCSVRCLDDQSGPSQSRIGKPRGSKRPGDGWGMTATGAEYNEAGGSTRYFKQVQETDMSQGIPQELWDYLHTMIAPPPSCDPVIIMDADLGGIDFSLFKDSSVHGLITVGNPEPYLKEIDRVLKPGAHLLLIAPEDEPTGHTGACVVEDFGYEIRDSVALLDAAKDFHYVAKASTSERNAGVPDFKRTVEVTRLFPSEGTDLGDLEEEMAEHLEEESIRIGFEEGFPTHEVPEGLRDKFVECKATVEKVHRNDHATVKPVGVMKRLLADVPTDALVVDPFVGSGTTGIACLETGHNFIGIEQDAEYLKIADQRIRHWDRTNAAWRGAEIESEAEVDEDEPVSLEDLLGG